MSLELCILASGSSGNCSLLRTPAGVVMLDAGLGPRTILRRLNGTGVSLEHIKAIVLTHLDADHFRREWVGECQRRRIKLFCHARRRDEVSGGNDATLAITRTFYDDRPFEPVPGLSFVALSLAHDADGSHGFVIEHAKRRIAFATDLGRVPPALIEQFCDLDILAIESNYCPQMQAESDRPVFLKRRITGGNGHLSNEQAFEAVRAIFQRCTGHGHRLPGHVVLLHRSRQCNRADVVRKVFSRDARIAARVVLAEAFERTEWLRPRDVGPAVGEQLALSFVG